MTLITDAYRALNRELHEKNEGYGAGLATQKWYAHIAKLAGSLKARDILDYGAGKGRLAHALPQFRIRSYDPAVPGIDQSPEPADMVVCLDVLEHIEPGCIDDVLDDIKRCSTMAVFLTVCMVPAGKKLSDGRNAHVLQRPPEWWIPKLLARWELRMFASNGYEFQVFLLAKASEQNQAEEAA